MKRQTEQLLKALKKPGKKDRRDSGTDGFTIHPNCKGINEENSTKCECFQKDQLKRRVNVENELRRLLMTL